MFTHKFLVGFCLVLSLAVTGPSYVAADDASYDLEVRMMIAAKSALDMLQGRDVQNVGVFKFRAMDDRHQITDDLGTANMRIAEQLTNSLMAVTLESGPAVHVALDANTVAANAPGAAHISPEGRKVLFEQDFQMSSGEHSKLDGLISGMFKLSRDLKSVSVAIMYADPTSEKLEPIVRFSAATDANFLAQCGERFQFVNRGPSDRLDGDQAAELALAAREDEQRPIVELDIFYNGKPVDVQEVDGELLIGEPTVRDSVHMVLRRLDRADEVLAVVLKVNGENVIYGDRKPDYTSQKIILHPDSPSCTIRGIWTDQAGHYRKFRVADETESRQLEIDYGPDVGLIQLVVFREAAEAVKPQLTQVEKAALKTAGVKTGMFSEDKAAFMVAYGDLSSIPEDLDSISEDLSSTPDEREGTVRKIIVESVWRDLNGSQSRGVITPGQIAKSKELREEEERNWDPNPIGSAVWRYRHSR